MTLTYIADSQALLSATAPRTLGAAALPAGFTVVSTAFIVSVGGSSTGPLPCSAGCAALVTVPLSEVAQLQSNYDYTCASLVDGQAYLDPAVATAAAPQNTSGTTQTLVNCTVTQAGTYLVARTPKAAASSTPQQAAPQQAVPAAMGSDEATAAISQHGSNSNVPAIVGGVVGSIAGAAVIAGVVLLVVKMK